MDKIKKLILASNSKSRATIMKRAGLDFISVPSEFDEEELKSKFGKVDNIDKAREYVTKLSYGKAKWLSSSYKDDVIIGADTIAFYMNEKLEKPKDEEDARRIFSLLSDTVHYCLTGVTIIIGDFEESFCEISEVKMDVIPKNIQDELVKDKLTYTYAGGYCVDGNLGDRITIAPKDFNNVMGLPIEVIMKKLDFYGYDFRIKR